MKKETGSGVDNLQESSNLRKFLGLGEVPRSAFVLLILLYIVASLALTRSARAQGAIQILNVQLPVTVFTGVFSSLANLCLIIVVVLFKKPGFITSLFILGSQFILIFINIFVRNITSSVPGIFSNLLTLIAIIIIYVSNRRSRKFQERVQEQAVKDALTGLPNRFAFGELIRELVRRRTKFAVVSVDLNNFKSINDTMGNDFGDQVLREVGNRWKDLAESSKTGTQDFVARLGGDEYALVIIGYGSDDDLQNTIRTYKAELEKTITIDEYDYYLTACFGYAEYPFDEDSSNAIFACADAALHELKRTSGAGNILRYSSELMRQEKNLEIERKIRAALENDGIYVNLQPQFDIDHKLRGFEALARMKDTDGTVIPPGEFIPTAERIGLIDRVDIQVFRKAAAFLSSVIKNGNRDLSLSINISVKHLMKNNFLDEIREVLESTGLPTDNLEIEITESIMIDSEKALKAIEDIKEMGIQVAIDDFGTGYSSLSYLNKLPADILKIDKSFIDEMNSSESSKQYVASIISIGHILQLKVISEGVETPDQLEVLRSIGCDYIQGFIWGKPLSDEDAAALAASS